ncbi:response regulator [Paenibacillus fonticola]|uniref:response regulator n=1 Tax=Paenibacillus fonticola TaxID=379896 RepID=UPI000373BC5F|nr:response regulator [Paenibacillus fonticola]
MDTAKIKVLIVDDEYLVRNLLKNCINWDYLNMEIVAEAADANEAFDLLEMHLPDLVITDIYMPIIDGITFSEMALQKYPHLKIAILSGYDDFQYAQRSIRAGVSDYLLKPIDDDEVLKTVTNLKAIIEQERKNNSENSKLRRRLYDNLPYLKDRFFNELLEEVSDKKVTTEKMSFLGVHFKYDSFQIAVIDISMADNKPLDEKSRLANSETILGIVRKYYERNPYTFAFFDAMNRVIILNNDEHSDLYEQCEWLKDTILQEASCSICIGLGDVKRDVNEICTSYKEALEAINYRVVVGNNMIILYNHIDLYSKHHSYDLNNVYNKLGFYIKAGLKDKLMETIDEIYENIDLKDTTIINDIRKIAMNIHMICVRKLTEFGLNPDDVQKIEAELYNYVVLDTIPDIKQHLVEVTEKTVRIINQHQVHKTGNSIDDIKKYIQEHYADSNLSLTELAKVFFLNPSYLSRTFKKETGTNFIEYLTTIRVENAIALLKEQDMKAFEIAKAVGISDSNYFSTCFKKYTGISVSDYRRTLKS